MIEVMTQETSDGSTASYADAAHKVDSPTGGTKNDGAKVRMELLHQGCPLALNEAALVMTLGAAKYGDYNWREVQTDRYFAAMYRHLTAYHVDASSLDAGTGQSHLSHVLCNILFLVELEQRAALGMRSVIKPTLTLNAEDLEKLATSTADAQFTEELVTASKEPVKPRGAWDLDSIKANLMTDSDREEFAAQYLQQPKTKPGEGVAVLAEIHHQASLGLSKWWEVVHYSSGAWQSYSGSKTFQDGEQVRAWASCSSLAYKLMIC